MAFMRLSHNNMKAAARRKSLAAFLTGHASSGIIILTYLVGFWRGLLCI